MISWRAYENKLKTVYTHFISCFYMFLSKSLRIFMFVDKTQISRSKMHILFNELIRNDGQRR